MLAIAKTTSPQERMSGDGETDPVGEGGYLAPLRQALGLTVEEFLPLRESATVRIGWEPADDPAGGSPGDSSTRVLEGTVWSDDIALEGAEVVSTYLDGPAAGRPAITRHAHGRGTGWYVSTRLGVDDLTALLEPVYRDAGLPSRAGVAGLEVVVRHGDGALKVPGGGVAVIRTTPGA